MSFLDALQLEERPAHRIFRQYLRKFVVFFDDIFVYSRLWEEHRQHLSVVLQVLQRERLFANKKNVVSASPN